MIVNSLSMGPRRSVLFMPASNRRALEKAKGFDCDGVIFDLEDSVSACDQDSARINLLEFVKNQDFGNLEAVVRVSAPGTEAYSQDLSVAIECRPDAILLPKVETEMVLNDLRAMLDYTEAENIKIWAMIETPLALVNLRQIASCNCGLEVLVVGPNDLARETGVPMMAGRQAMVPWLMDIIVHGRANGLGILDGVYNSFRDSEGLAQECRQGVSMGFDGKTLIHPNQIDVANKAFSPSKADIIRASRIVALFGEPENSGKGALQLDGEMVEELHLEWAQVLLQLNDKLDAHSI